MKYLSKAFIIFLILSSNWCLASEASNKEEIQIRFHTALAAYENHVITNPDPELIPLAKELYEAGSKLYAAEDITLGILAIYYANALNNRLPNNESIPLFEQAISIYKGAEEVPQKKLINAYVEFGKFYYQFFNKRIKGKSYFNKALDVAEKNNDKLQIASTKLDIGKIFLSYGTKSKNMTNKARKYIESSYTVFKEAGIPKQIEASFWAGKANLFAKKEKLAANYFEKTINSASDKQVEQHYSMASHAFLVVIYSKLGDEEKATEHSQIIGKNQIWDDTVEPKPLYVVSSLYPRKAIKNKKEGFVTMKFTIDKNGFAKNVSVANSSGDKAYEEDSIITIKKWRFAPKFENGIPVEAEANFTMSFGFVK